jgi:hypothetical protein
MKTPNGSKTKCMVVPSNTKLALRLNSLISYPSRTIQGLKTLLLLSRATTPRVFNQISMHRRRQRKRSTSLRETFIFSSSLSPSRSKRTSSTRTSRTRSTKTVQSSLSSSKTRLLTESTINKSSPLSSTSYVKSMPSLEVISGE